MKIYNYSYPSYLKYLNEDIFTFIKNDDNSYYPDTDILKMNSCDLNKLINSSIISYNIISKVANNIIDEKSDDYVISFLNNLKLFEKTNKIMSFISRLDFIKDTNNNFRLLEINADTPTAIIESYYANKIACEFYNINNPNENCLKDIKNLFIEYKNKYVVFCGDMINIKEDSATTNFLYNNCGLYNKDICDLSDLIVNDTGVYLNNKKIEVLYLLYPKEFLINDKSRSGALIGLKLLNHAKNNELILINPIESIIMQSKYTYTKVYKNYKMYDDIFIPTYSTKEEFIKNDYDKDYIKKPIYGREGEGITIYHNNNKSIQSPYDPKYYNSYIYQEYINSFDHSSKIKRYITYSVFIINGKSSAVFARADYNNPIISTKSNFIPIGVYN